MSDLVYVGLATAFFWLTWRLVALCAPLEGGGR